MVRKSALMMAGLVAGMGVSSADAVLIEVQVESLVPSTGVTFAPLRVGFHSGVFDAFDAGSAAPLLGEADISAAPIVSIAESGSGVTWFPAFEAADPTATLGTVVSDPAGPLTPGQTATAVFDVDPTINPYFTFAAMVVPSNDQFIGNDSPTAYTLLDAEGNLLINEIIQTGADVWDAGSETADVAAAAFLAGSDNSLRTNENDVVSLDISEFATYDGLETAAGYFFDSDTLTSSGEIYRISFSVVPEPASASMAGLLGLGLIRRRLI